MSQEDHKRRHNSEPRRPQAVDTDNGDPRRSQAVDTDNGDLRRSQAAETDNDVQEGRIARIASAENYLFPWQRPE